MVLAAHARAARSQFGGGRAPQLDRLNTIDEVVAFAKVHRRTVERAIANGRLKVMRAGARGKGSVRITDGAVWAWLDER